MPYTTLATVFLLFGGLLLLLPFYFRIWYQRDGADDHIVIDTTALGKMIRYRLRIPVTELTMRKKVPWLETEIESRGGEAESHALAEQSKTWKWIRFYVNHPEAMQKKLDALTDALNDYSDFMRWVTSRIRFERFYWVTRIGIEDAAVTAILTGLLWAIKGHIVANLWNKNCCTRAKPVIRITPEYNREHFATDFECIFSIRLGHIIGAGIRLLRYKV